MSPDRTGNVGLIRCARVAGLRALAWSGDTLYAARGYDLLRARVQDPSRVLHWEFIGSFRPSWRRKLTVRNRLTARLFREIHPAELLPRQNSREIQLGSAQGRKGKLYLNAYALLKFEQPRN